MAFDGSETQKNRLVCSLGQARNNRLLVDDGHQEMIARHASIRLRVRVISSGLR